MGLKETINKFNYSQNGVCPFQQLIDKLSPEDQKTIAEAWERGISIFAVTKALRAEGYRIAEASISDHRKEMCRCFKKS